MFNNGYGSSYGIGYGSNPLVNAGGILIFCLILSIVAAIIIYAVFMAKKNEGKYTGFTAWLYDFLHFKKLFIEGLVKITYVALAIYVTLAGIVSFFMLAGVNFGLALLTLLTSVILGNVIVRVIYEFLMIQIVICKNTTDINDKLTKIVDNTTPADQKEKAQSVFENIDPVQQASFNAAPQQTVAPQEQAVPQQTPFNAAPQQNPFNNDNMQ